MSRSSCINAIITFSTVVFGTWVVGNYCAAFNLNTNASRLSYRTTFASRSSRTQLTMAVCIADLSTFSEPDLSSSSFKTKSVTVGFGDWYQTMDHRLARPNYYDNRMRFYTTEDDEADWMMPSQRWPSMERDSSCDNLILHDSFEAEQRTNLLLSDASSTTKCGTSRRPRLPKLRRIVQWALRRNQ